MNSEINWIEVHNLGFDQWEFEDPSVPGSGDLIDPLTLMLVVGVRTTLVAKKLATAVIVTSAVDVHGTHGHADDSYHLFKNMCKAIDFFPVSDAPPRQLYHEVAKCGFTGLGAYYDWEYKGNPIPIGFHGDSRPAEQAQRWRRENGKYTYLLC